MNSQNLSRFARKTRSTGPARTGFAAPKAWATLIVLGCVGLGAMAQTAAPTLGGVADRTANSAAIRATPARTAVQGAAQGALGELKLGWGASCCQRREAGRPLKILNFRRLVRFSNLL